jgi:hypothetical protein
MDASLLKAQIEQILPAAFTVYPRKNLGSIPTGIAQIDDAVHGIPLHSLTEICGSNLASSGKTSVLLSLLAQATREHFCALVDAHDCFDPASGYAVGIVLSRLLWIRCGKSRGGLPPLEQAFKVADILLQSGGFGLIAVDLSGIPERIVRRVPLSSWFRFSRVIERQPAALVFIGQEPHATSCAGLVLRADTESIGGTSVEANAHLLTGKLFAQRMLKVEILRSSKKKPAASEKIDHRHSSSAPKFTTESLKRSEYPFPRFSPYLRASVVNSFLYSQWA